MNSSTALVRCTRLSTVLSETHTFPHGRLPSDLIKSITVAVSGLLVTLHAKNEAHGSMIGRVAVGFIV